MECLKAVLSVRFCSLSNFNDISGCCNFQNDFVDIFMFADDTKLSSTNPDMLQISINSVDNWLQTRQLKLAYNKCFLMQIGKTGHDFPLL